MADEKVTFKVDGEKVSVHHKTLTLSGEKWFDTTFDFTNVSHNQLLKWAADQRKIAWRAQAGVKKLTEGEIALKGLYTANVDCSKVVERVKHVETPEEIELRATLKGLLSGQGGTKMSMGELLKRIKEISAKNEEPTDEEYSAGETVE